MPLPLVALGGLALRAAGSYAAKKTVGKVISSVGGRGQDQPEPMAPQPPLLQPNQFGEPWVPPTDQY